MLALIKTILWKSNAAHTKKTIMNFFCLFLSRVCCDLLCQGNGKTLQGTLRSVICEARIHGFCNELLFNRKQTKWISLVYALCAYQLATQGRCLKVRQKISLFEPRLHADTDKLERFDEAREIAPSSRKWWIDGCQITSIGTHQISLDLEWLSFLSSREKTWRLWKMTGKETATKQCFALLGKLC